MDKFKNIILAGTLAFSAPYVTNAGENIQIKKVVLNTSEKIKNSLDMEIIFLLNNIYSKKTKEINNFLINYNQNTGNYLARMPIDDFQKLVDDIYENNLDILTLKKSDKFKNTNIDYILKKNKSRLEKNFDELFGIMISQGESERAFLYMGYLSDKYGYKFDNFVKNYFTFDFIPKGLVKENIDIFREKIDNKKSEIDIKDFIKKLNGEDFFGKDYLLLDDYMKKIVDIYISIIKTKLKELYIN